MSLRQAITTASRTVALEQVDEPPRPRDQARLLLPGRVGRHLRLGHRDVGWHRPVRRFPVRQGHEFSARILDVRTRAMTARWQAGQLVAVEPLLPDGTCIACRRGRPNCCVGLRVIGAHVDGALADRIVVPVANLYPCR